MPSSNNVSINSRLQVLLWMSSPMYKGSVVSRFWLWRNDTISNLPLLTAIIYVIVEATALMALHLEVHEPFKIKFIRDSKVLGNLSY